jgi:hypothetical protein
LERSPSANPSASAPPASKRCETCTIVSFQGRSDRHFGALSGHRWSSGYWICIRKHLWNLMNVWNWIWIANPVRHFVKTVSRLMFVKTLVRCSFHYANANPMIRIPGGDRHLFLPEPSCLCTGTCQATCQDLEHGWDCQDLEPSTLESWERFRIGFLEGDDRDDLMTISCGNINSIPGFLWRFIS